MKINNVDTIRKPNSSYYWDPLQNGNYIIHVVSESGNISDQRPYNVYYEGENNRNWPNVSPYSFIWRHDIDGDPGAAVADFLIDTNKNPYWYQYNPSFDESVAGRDSPRRIINYLDPDPDPENNGRPIKNGYDDGVFMSFEEADDNTPGIILTTRD